MRYFCHLVKESHAILAYDLHAGNIFRNATDYGITLIDEYNRAIDSTYAHILNICSFCNYLQKSGHRFESVNSNMLREYKNFELTEVLKNNISTGTNVRAQRTVDRKLISIYRWILWLQTVGRVPSGTIGPYPARVLCGTTSFSSSFIKRQSYATELYPLLSKKRRGNGHSGPAYNREQQDNITSKLLSRGETEHVSRRNALIADLAAETGMRRESILSLRIDQFDAKSLADCRDEVIEIEPSRQKFGYSNRFACPLWLALEVASFIEGPRELHLLRFNRSQDKTKIHEIFLSDRSSQPISARAITKIFSNIAREIGAKPRAAIHAFRHLFATEQAVLEISERVAAGLPTDTQSICLALALKLGHKNWKSVFPYVTQAQAKLGVERIDSIRSLQSEKAELEAEIRKLRAKLQRIEEE